MNHRQRFTHAPTFASLAFASLTLAFTAGCSSGQSSGTPESTGSYVQDLTTDLGVCTVAHDTCMQAADGDVPKIDSCKSEASDCKDAVSAARQEIHTAIRACADTARTCFVGAADGG